ncbi:hypothetical protein Ahy_A03g012349 [Arachis hypogaea]|uniref:Myb/SANT-like domain-containing protein n=1 Tax=Arachis hypogaea TaxID=3818 RepID=A0A445DT59_ARAHY|nr:hypothetical protein Ahy_A03g012349 [Arachis hypogaea]
MDGENIEDANVEDKTNVIPDLGFQVNQVTSTDLYHPEPIQILTHVREELEKRQHICVTSLSCVTVHTLYSLEFLSQYRPRQISYENLERENRRTQLMTQILTSEKCRDVIRYIMPNKGKKTAEANQPLKDNLRWSDDMDEVLLNALAEEASKGNRHDGSWTTEAYANEKPQAEKWKKMQIKHYNTLKELFGADRATGKGAATSRERIQEIARDHINLNDSFENVGFSDIDVNMGHDTPTFFANLDSPSGPHSQPNQLGGTSTSRGTKRKSPMNDFLEAQYEKVALGITTMADAVKEGTYLSSKLHDVAQRQVESAKRQASVAERQVSVAEKQVSLIERQVAIA